MMQLILLAALAPLTVAVSARSFDATSPALYNLLSKSRRLNNNNNNNNKNNNQNANFAATWVSSFSVKYQGCFDIPQWNYNANGYDDVRVATKSLVRFRLCPSDQCSPISGGGCSEGYGDYVVDMNTYLEAFVQLEGNFCAYLEKKVCNCNNDNGQDSEEACLNSCFSEYGVESCMGDVQAKEDNANFDISQAVQCQQYKFSNNNNNNNGEQYFLGPYCADQGGSIFLGLFTDDTCTSFADSYNGRETFQSATGYNLPYGTSNVVEYDCISCDNEAYAFENGQAGVVDMCQTLYTASGKCESQISSTYLSSTSPNENACSYMSGISIVRKDGVIVAPLDYHANHVARIFIFTFMGVFVLLAAYVWFLKSKLDRASMTLVD